MRIVTLSTSDRGGGAEQVALSLFEAFQAQGHESWLVVGTRRGSDPRVVELPSRGLWSLGLGVLDRLRGIEDFRFPGTALLAGLVGARPDIIHCHNLHGGYFDLRALRELARVAPVALTLHDAWLLSGHCAHSFDCERWKIGCGQCPDLGIYPSVLRDATDLNWKRKQEIFQGLSLHVAAPSRFLLDKVPLSLLGPASRDTRLIPNGVDLAVFHPGPRSEARARLGLPPDARIALFAAKGVRQNPFKDFATLREAARRLGSRKTLVIALGEAGPSEQLGETELRFVSFRPGVADYYRAADLYLHAALADTFPSTVLEALACGLPVIATAVGGIPEQIEDGATGFLVPPRDAAAMAARAELLFNDPPLRSRLGAAAAETARKNFGIERCAAGYLRWFEQVSANG